MKKYFSIAVPVFLSAGLALALVVGVFAQQVSVSCPSVAINMTANCTMSNFVAGQMSINSVRFGAAPITFISTTSFTYRAPSTAQIDTVEIREGTTPIATTSVVITDPCIPSPCGNQATCSSATGTAVCTCVNGGSNPPTCTPPNPCAGGGGCGSLATCNGSSGTAVCTCVNGGSNPPTCTPPDPCAGNNCSGHGNCSGGVCTCTPGSGYSGPTCATLTCSPGTHNCSGTSTCVTISPTSCTLSCITCPPGPAGSPAPTCSASDTCVTPTCPPGKHNCSGTCVTISDSSCTTTGPSACSACPAPTPAGAGSASCNTSTDTCTSTCSGDNHLCTASNTCASNTDINKCGASCSPCAQPDHSTATCTGGTTCGFTCDQFYKPVGAECQLRTCGASDPAPARDSLCTGSDAGLTADASFHLVTTCSVPAAGKCEYRCSPPYVPNGTTCSCPAGYVPDATLLCKQVPADIILDGCSTGTPIFLGQEVKLTASGGAPGTTNYIFGAPSVGGYTSTQSKNAIYKAPATLTADTDVTFTVTDSSIIPDFRPNSYTCTMHILAIPGVTFTNNSCPQSPVPAGSKITLTNTGGEPPFTNFNYSIVSPPTGGGFVGLATGQYTAPNSAPSPNEVTIRAMNMNSPTSSADCTVAVGPPPPVVLTCPVAPLMAGATTNSVSATSGLSGTLYSFSVSAGGGTLNATGSTTFSGAPVPASYTAPIPAPQGNYAVLKVMESLGMTQSQCPVTVNDRPRLTLADCPVAPVRVGETPVVRVSNSAGFDNDITFSLSAGSANGVITDKVPGPARAVFTATASTNGAASVIITAKDSKEPANIVSCPPFAVADAAVNLTCPQTVVTGRSYSVIPSGGRPGATYTYTASTGANQYANGVYTVPATAAGSPVTLTVTDASITTNTKTCTIQNVVTPVSMVCPSSIVAGATGNVTITGGFPGTTYTQQIISPAALRTGETFANGVYTAPATAVPGGVTLRADDAHTGDPAYQNFAVCTVNSIQSPLAITGCPQTSNGLAYAPGQALLSASGGLGPYTWTVSPASGTITASGSGNSVASYSTGGLTTGAVTITVTDANTPAAASKTCSFTIDPKPVTGITVTPDKIQIGGGSYTFAIAGGPPAGSPLTWSLIPGTGSMGPGLITATTGIYTSTSDQNTQFQVKVTDNTVPANSFTKTFSYAPAECSAAMLLRTPSGAILSGSPRGVGVISKTVNVYNNTVYRYFVDGTVLPNNLAYSVLENPGTNVVSVVSRTNNYVDVMISANKANTGAPLNSTAKLELWDPAVLASDPASASPAACRYEVNLKVAGGGVRNTSPSVVNIVPAP